MAADKKWKDGLPSTREWQERTRAKIAASNVIEDALKAASGEIEISGTRATMIKTLLDRVLPAQTQTDATVTTTDKPADMQALKSAIAQSPELQAMLKGLLANGGTNQEAPTPAATPANTTADPLPKDVGNMDGWTKVSTTDRDGKAIMDRDGNVVMDRDGNVVMDRDGNAMEVYVLPSPSLPLN